ncbi:PIN domain-containing protein [Desulfothermus naphthae]
MKLYLDCCCLNRPFDDQSNPTVHIESEAIKIIISLCEKKIFILVSSEILEFEINKTPDILRRERLKIIESIAEDKIEIDERIEKRAKYFEDFGLQSFDALHLACAETKCDLLITVDRKFLRRTKEITDLKIRVMNPLEFLKEVLYERDG